MKHWVKGLVFSLSLILLVAGCNSDGQTLDEQPNTPEKEEASVPTQESPPPEKEDEYAWVLVDTRTWANSSSGAPSGDWSEEETLHLENELFLYHELTGPHDYVQYYAKVSDMSIEYMADRWKGEPPGTVHVIYTWTDPPTTVTDMETVTITLSQEIISNFTENYYLSRLLSCQARIDTRDLSGPGHLTYFQGTFPDGTNAQTGGRGALSNSYEHDSYKLEVSTIDLHIEFGDKYKAAKEGERRSIEVKIITRHEIGTRYTYEFKRIE